MKYVWEIIDGCWTTAECERLGNPEDLSPRKKALAATDENIMDAQDS